MTELREIDRRRGRRSGRRRARRCGKGSRSRSCRTGARHWRWTWGPKGTRLHRYEAAADRLFRSAWTKLEHLRKERGEPLMPRCERGFAAEPAPRPTAAPPPARRLPAPPVPPARPLPDFSRSPLLGDPAAPVLDFWVAGPPRPGISPGHPSQNKTNPAPSRPANGATPHAGFPPAARRRNLP